jgi:hypothetical protein
MRNAKIAAFLLVLMFLALVFNSSSLPDSLAQGGRDPWEDEEATAEMRIPPDESGPGLQHGQPALHSGHLGYDKETGQLLDDPTVHTDSTHLPFWFYHPSSA